VSDERITPELIRLLREAYASAPAGTASGPCGDPEEIWRAVQGGLSPARVADLLDHALACTACDRAFVLARTLLRETAVGTAGTESPPVSIRRSPALTRRTVVAGLGLVAAAAVAILALRRPPTREEPPFREAPAGSITPLPGTEHLPRGRFLLRWSAGPPGSRYSLWVATPELRELYAESRLETSEQLVPASALAGVPEGADVLWRVEAHLPDGTHLASPAFRTRVE
jgi:hypothetical protein